MKAALARYTALPLMIAGVTPNTLPNAAEPKRMEPRSDYGDTKVTNAAVDTKSCTFSDLGKKLPMYAMEDEKLPPAKKPIRAVKIINVT